MNFNPFVSIHMATYNHEPYIAQAIESVVNQKTDFNFELIIGEDCSADRTGDIVFKYKKKYPEIIKVITSDKNVGPLLNWKRVFDECKGKYLAHCEGDDFLHDEHKLQKQVNFLETHPDYGIIHSDLDQLYQKKNKLIKNYNKSLGNKIPEGYIYEELLDPSKYIIKTVTTLIRKELLDKYFDFSIALKRKWKLLDLAIWLDLSKHSRIKYLNTSTATYRVLENSLSNLNLPDKRFEFHKMVYDVRFYYANKYGCSDLTKNKLDIYHNKSLLADAYSLKNKVLSNKAYEALKSLNYNLTLKERLFYFLTKLRF